MNSPSLRLGLPVLAAGATAVLAVTGLGFGSTERVPRPAIEIIPVTAPRSVAPATPLPAAPPDSSPGLELVRVEGVAGWRVTDPARLPVLKAAGLMAGDVIFAINGSAVGGTSTAIAAATSGSEGEIEYWRDGNRYNISLADRLSDDDD